MRKTSFFIQFCLLTLPLFAFCQDKQYDINDTENFLLLRDGTLLKEGEFVKKQANILGENFQYTNGTKIKVADVKYYRTPDGYFGMYKVNAVTFRSSIRRATGTVELYERTVNSTHYHSAPISGGMGTYTRSSSKVNYIARPFGELKLMNSKNLKEAFVLDPLKQEQNKVILKYVNKGNTQKWSRYALTIAGMGAIIAGVLMYPLGDSQDPKPSPVPAIVIGGTGLVAMQIGILLHPEKSYLKALDEYNAAY
jgi:hypothetical protein